MSKSKLAIISLTSCEGCQFALLDQGKEFLKLIRNIELSEFRLVEERQLREKYFDIALVEGNPITKENLKLLKEVRKKAKILITLGNCADMGGIPGIRNYKKSFDAAKYVYQNERADIAKKVDKISNIVQPDYVLAGCPINAKDFTKLIYSLISGLEPEHVSRPICWECQINGYECLLQRGEICLGPITSGGCEAVCLKSKQACWGCRGMINNANKESFIKALKNGKHKQKDINETMEVFGIREEVEEEFDK